MSRKCFVCQTEETQQKPLQQCSSCKSSFYCSKEHQVSDWKERHKNLCSLIKSAQSNGFAKTILVKGEENSVPPKLSNVSVHYVGTLLNGNKFDSSRDRNETFSFKVGGGQVIKGWDEGVGKMNKGEKSLFVISPSYGYGSRDMRTIPSNSYLVFEVELFGWTE
eukprot:TRINITY_DN3597_c0_g1_i1.p1 TRINITY_DN3597_c0_g1~~TRINITY_DN3597_c0_g1_i1.p1  ORF type:complete len:164 (-),score=45.99 TRINITY_DN3597_c0_g1_i1:60-551(-)